MGQWGGAGGAICEDHFAFCGELWGFARGFTCVTPALFPDDDDAEDDAEDKGGEDPEEAKELDSVSSEGGAEPAGEDPATWHGSSVEVDDLWPQTQEVSPRSMEL